MNWTEKIQVTREDCMDLMARYPDKYFDLAIVDPPYGIGITNSNRLAISRNLGGKSWDDNKPNELYFIELIRLAKNIIIWGANYFGLPPTKCFFIWDKKNDGRDFADCEYAWTNMNTVARIFRMRPMNMNGGKIHPTEKPIKLYEWILTNYAQPGNKILDTHLGSGSHAIACHNLGYELTACELDEEYYEAARKRFKLITSQQRLF